jgi:hypothetical protein
MKLQSFRQKKREFINIFKFKLLIAFKPENIRQNWNIFCVSTLEQIHENNYRHILHFIRNYIICE